MSRPKIYAVDFDGTLCSYAWPNIGRPHVILIRFLMEERAKGNKVILWTCRVDEKLKEAVEWCENLGLTFDAINENLPEIVEAWGSDSRKIFANEYIDDRAVHIDTMYDRLTECCYA